MGSLLEMYRWRIDRTFRNMTYTSQLVLTFNSFNICTGCRMLLLKFVFKNVMFKLITLNITVRILLC